MGRSGHAAVCLGYGGDHPCLLVTGGLDMDKTVLSDAWILDLQSGKWREVRVSIILLTVSYKALSPEQECEKHC